MVARTTVALLTFWLGLAALGAEAPRTEGVLRFSPAPQHLKSIAFSPAGDSLFAVDLARGSIEVFDLTGRRLRTVKRPGLGELDFNQPGELVPWQGGYLLSSRSLHLLWLDKTLESKTGWLLPSRSEPPDARRIAGPRGALQEVAVWQAAPLSEQTLLLTGDYLDSQGWRHGVARLDGGDPLRLTLLSERRVDDPSYLYELNLRPNLAKVGNDVYELRFGAAATVERVFPAPGRIPLPKPFDAPLPSVAGMGGRDRYLALFGKLRTVPLPAAIYGWRDSLYLLTWTPKPAGGLQMDLWRWGAPGWRGPLSVEAPPATRQILAAPGPSHWAFVFQPAPRDPESQETLGFRLVDAAEIERRLR